MTRKADQKNLRTGCKNLTRAGRLKKKEGQKQTGVFFLRGCAWRMKLVKKTQPEEQSARPDDAKKQKRIPWDAESRKNTTCGAI